MTRTAEQVWRMAVVRSGMGFQFCCGSCDRVSEPRALDATVAMMVGHQFAEHFPPDPDDLNEAEGKS